MRTMDEYALKSKLRNYSAKSKLIFGMTLLLAALLNSDRYFLLAIILIVSVISLLGKAVTIKEYLKILSIPLLFILFSAVTAIVEIDSKNYWKGVDLGLFHAGISIDGISKCSTLILRALAAFSSILFIVLNTTMGEIIKVLVGFGIPKTAIDMGELTYRLIFILIESAEQIIAAQNSRLGHTTLRNRLYSFRLFSESLLRISINKAEKIAIAIETRSFEND